MKPLRSRAPSLNWLCQHASQMSERRKSSARSSKSSVCSDCRSANGWVHASQAWARDWMVHSFMGGEFSHRLNTDETQILKKKIRFCHRDTEAQRTEMNF